MNEFEGVWKARLNKTHNIRLAATISVRKRGLCQGERIVALIARAEQYRTREPPRGGHEVSQRV